MALLDIPLRADGDLARFCIPEEQHLLCGEGDHEHRNVILQDLACRDLQRGGGERA